MDLDPHKIYMRMALRQAQAAFDEGEVPTGCAIIRISPDKPSGMGTLIGSAHNQVELLKDPTAHAEIIAITQASNAIGDWRLTDTVLYVTKEPCPMCAGAIVSQGFQSWSLAWPIRNAVAQARFSTLRTIPVATTGARSCKAS